MSHTEYKSRPLTAARATFLTEHANVIRAHTDSRGNVTLDQPAWRQRTMYSFIGCDHTERALVEVENEHGKWGLEICVNCGRAVAGPECPHVSSSWNSAGTVLTCDNCGIDGT